MVITDDRVCFAKIDLSLSLAFRSPIEQPSTELHVLFDVTGDPAQRNAIRPLESVGKRIDAFSGAADAAERLADIMADENPHLLLLCPVLHVQQKVAFELGAQDFELVSQLIDGAFPDYKGIIPTSSASRTVLSTQSFLKACKAADIFAREAAHSAKLRITPGGDLEPGTVEVSATSAETGSNEVVVDASIEGEPIEIAFNVRFLIDVLNVVETSEVSLETNGSSSPGVIRPVGRDDFLHVVMPMHLGR